MKAKDLKNSILQMAIEGKLVPQDPNDEPASVLLERIREEKHKLIAEGKAKFPKGGESIIYIGSDGSPYEKRADAKGHVTSDKCIANEMPFEELPEGWCWTRLSNVASIQLGKMLDKQKNQGDLAPYLGNANVQWGRFDLANVKTMSMDEMDRAKYALSDGDLIVCEGGVPGRCAIWTSNETMHYQKALHRIRCSKRLLLNTYCELYICFIVQSHVWDSCFTGTTIKHLPAQTLSSWLLPLPPLAEQRRIVGRVNELMPLVEEYGGLEDAREALDAALPGRLRKSVLQLAVQGGLAPQDPADEPAAVLLERIRGQRRQLVAEGKMKAPKGGESIIFAGSDGRRYEKRVDARGRESEPVCIEDEIPFEIPEGWEWARLGSVFTKMGSGSTPAGGRKVYQDKGPMLIRSQNVHNEGLRLDDVAHFAYSLFTKRGSHVLPNDMLLNITGASIGRCAIVPDAFGDADVNQHVLIMRPVLPIASEYLHAAIISPLVQSAIMVGQVGATKEGLSASKAAELLVPFPPLVEQHRIVDVVDRVFKLLA